MPGPGAATAALLPAVLLAVLAPWASRGSAAAPTAPNGTLEAELERRWESLVARSLARLPVASQPKEAAVQSGAGDYLLGIKRLRRLYCNVGIGFHLQVLRDGRIGGVHADTSDSEWGGRAERGGVRHSGHPFQLTDTCLGLWEPGGTEVRVPLARGRGGANHLGSCAAAGTGFAHPAAEPHLPAFSSPGSSCGIPAPSPVGTGRAAPQPPGIRALVGAWLGGPRGPGRRKASPNPRALGSGALWGRPAPGSPNPYPHPRTRGPKRGAGRGGSGAGKGSPFPQ